MLLTSHRMGKCHTYRLVLISGFHCDKGDAEWLCFQHPVIIVGLTPGRWVKVTSHCDIDNGCGTTGWVAIVMGDDPDLQHKFLM